MIDNDVHQAHFLGTITILYATLIFVFREIQPVIETLTYHLFLYAMNNFQN